MSLFDIVPPAWWYPSSGIVQWAFSSFLKRSFSDYSWCYILLVRAPNGTYVMVPKLLWCSRNERLNELLASFNKAACLHWSKRQCLDETMAGANPRTSACKNMVVVVSWECLECKWFMSCITRLPMFLCSIWTDFLFRRWVVSVI